MGKIYGAPWTPDNLMAAREEIKKNNTKEEMPIEGDEVLDEEGLPQAGYSAYGLKIKKHKKKQGAK